MRIITAFVLLLCTSAFSQQYIVKKGGTKIVTQAFEENPFLKHVKYRSNSDTDKISFKDIDSIVNDRHVLKPYNVKGSKMRVGYLVMSAKSKELVLFAPQMASGNGGLFEFYFYLFEGGKGAEILKLNAVDLDEVDGRRKFFDLVKENFAGCAGIEAQVALFGKPEDTKNPALAKYLRHPEAIPCNGLQKAIVASETSDAGQFTLEFADETSFEVDKVNINIYSRKVSYVGMDGEKVEVKFKEMKSVTNKKMHFVTTDSGDGGYYVMAKNKQGKSLGMFNFTKTAGNYSWNFKMVGILDENNKVIERIELELDDDKRDMRHRLEAAEMVRKHFADCPKLLERLSTFDDPADKRKVRLYDFFDGAFNNDYCN